MASLGWLNVKVLLSTNFIYLKLHNSGKFYRNFSSNIVCLVSWITLSLRAEGLLSG